MANFIQQAIKRPGALTRKAMAAGMSVHAYAQAHKSDKGLTGQQARFYLGVLAPASARHSRSQALARRLQR